MSEMMRKLVKQGPDAYGLWYRIYHIQEHITFRIITGPIGKPPDENPLRTWLGQIYKEEECMLEFQETLKRSAILSPYVTWKSEGGTVLMSFHYRDFDIIFELVTQALTEYEG